MELLKWIEKQLSDQGIKKYNLYPLLVTVNSSSSVSFEQKNDIYFLANAYTSGSKPLIGEIIGSDDALQLTPAIMKTKCYKHQHFTGRIDLSNMDATDKLYVEFLMVTPIK